MTKFSSTVLLDKVAVKVSSRLRLRDVIQISYSRLPVPDNTQSDLSSQLQDTPWDTGSLLPTPPR